MHRYEYDGITVLSAAALSDYKVPLAVALARSIRLTTGQRATFAFVSDLIKDKALFPEGSSRPMMEQRILRTLQTPVQVGEVVLMFENSKKSRMYEKTKKVVVQHTTLAALGIGGGEIPSYAEPVRAEISTYATPAVRAARVYPVGPAVSEVPLVRVPADDTRLTKIEDNIAKLWEHLVLEGVSPSTATSAGPSTEEFMKSVDETLDGIVKQMDEIMARLTTLEARAGIKAP